MASAHKMVTVKNRAGIHARPAGMLAKAAKALDSEVTITKDGNSVGATKLMALMGLAVKCGETITVSIEGGNESVSEAAMKKFLEENL